MKFKGILTAAALCAAGILSGADLAIKTGDTLAFLGDSITQYGNNYPTGYLHLVIDGLKRSGANVKMIPTGYSGHKSNIMLARVERDVIKKNATWMTLSCGVNDVWHGKNGVELDAYKKNITALVDKVQKAGVKVMILTATMIGENVSNGNNQKLIGYNEFLRNLAKERKFLIADLNADMQKIIATMKAADKKPSKNKLYLTRDGVHMAKEGNIMMATGILAAFGVPADKLAEYAKIWRTWPENTKIQIQFTLEEWNALHEAANKAKKNIYDYSKSVIIKDMKAK